MTDRTTQLPLQFGSAREVAKALFEPAMTMKAWRFMSLTGRFSRGFLPAAVSMVKI